jgi:phage recombination protein Bet
MTTTTALATTPGLAISQFSRDQIDLIKWTVAKGATDNELKLLLELAAKYDLDPFAKEIWCIKLRENDAALIMTSRDGYLKVAQRNPDYRGLAAAVVRKGDHFKFNPALGTVDHEFGPERGAIIGAWAMVHHRTLMPVTVYVDFAEYKGATPIWTKFPSAMIQKVAEAFVLKRAFGISGLVTKEEMDAEAPGDERPRATHPSSPEYRAPVFTEAEQGVVDAWKASKTQLAAMLADAKAAGFETKDDFRAWLPSLFEGVEHETQLLEPEFKAVMTEHLPARKRFIEAIATEDPAAQHGTVD